MSNASTRKEILALSIDGRKTRCERLAEERLHQLGAWILTSGNGGRVHKSKCAGTNCHAEAWVLAEVTPDPEMAPIGGVAIYQNHGHPYCTIREGKSMLLILKRDWAVNDASKGEERKTTIPSGQHEVERIDNPLGYPDAPWLVLKGTLIGATEGFWRQWDGPKWGEFEVTIED